MKSSASSGKPYFFTFSKDLNLPRLLLGLFLRNFEKFWISRNFLAPISIIKFVEIPKEPSQTSVNPFSRVQPEIVKSLNIDHKARDVRIVENTSIFFEKAFREYSRNHEEFSSWQHLIKAHGTRTRAHQNVVALAEGFTQGAEAVFSTSISTAIFLKSLLHFSDCRFVKNRTLGNQGQRPFLK